MSLATCGCLSEEMSWNINLASESFIRNVRNLQETCFVPINFAQGTVAVGAGLLFLSLQEVYSSISCIKIKAQCIESSRTVDKAIKPDKQEINKIPLCPERFDSWQEQDPGDLWHSQRQKKPSPESPPSVNPNGDLSVWLVVDIVCWEAVSRIALKQRKKLLGATVSLSLLTTPLANDTCLKPTPVDRCSVEM